MTYPAPRLHPSETHVSSRAPFMSPFLRPVAACRSLILPGHFLPFRLGERQIGWVSPHLLPALKKAQQELPTHALQLDKDGVTLSGDNPDLPALLEKALHRSTGFLWRDEPFDIRETIDGPVLFQLDRGVLPMLGVLAQGVHANGLVYRPDGLHLWVSRRSATRPLDPGKLDHLAAGGIPAGHTPFDALIKEAAEEASIPETLVRQARKVAVLTYRLERPEGLRRDVLHCFDLDLPESFIPHAGDGESAGFELMPVKRAMEIVAETDEFKFNVNLVLIDLFLRLGLIHGAEAELVSRALYDEPHHAT
ncbi:Thiamin pyrophosphokinase [Granulibacter bethesdensis]|uniref:Thiamin pyrophosphokinase n=2 Tax=Granulibacter bethesdensis TaxID=364410 RepID=Q0BUJ3_GRABC|nr:Thiamin pyrophosphokinase [Granulibacter bethesdensis CGDNIH1]AHJ67642.1 Thiamin pyrophosphokinase [Granulibacter bethesdensis]APH51306.1 Thiamin pyrophosphokinase [Granulibacter bethesdensis]APH64000.1 Thiamin pyrophosphokinase [Granulibacter bethesdensis]